VNNSETVSRESSPRAFGSYARTLSSFVNDSLLGKQVDPSRILRILDGEPGKELRRLVSLDFQRSAGAFFTGERLAQQLCDLLPTLEESSGLVLDPACGAGDLLVAYSKRLPLAKDLISTLTLWGRTLAGSDLYEEFVEATKLRLALAAIGRGVPIGPTASAFSITHAFPNISVDDGLGTIGRLGKSSAGLIVNPPYTARHSPVDCDWADGDVSSAAVFLDACVSRTKPGCRIVAILPDVLRTGSRYERWRKHIESRARIEDIEIVGRFNQWADVDVFMLRLVVGGKGDTFSRQSWWRHEKDNTSLRRVGDAFTVCVGPVVPHRDPHKGPWNPFIHARPLPAWETYKEVGTLRRYLGKTFKPPFVAVRRTSSPSDKSRAIGTIISGHRDVAVENHLLVLLPNDLSMQMQRCKELLSILKDSRTTEWLNRRIRCRHLTVLALREMPWWEQK
jgi:hypothetical protein